MCRTLFSVPARIGIARALWIAKITHALCLAFTILLAATTPELGGLFWIGVAIAALLLVIERGLVTPTDLSKVGVAFFTVNGVISVLLGTLGVIDVLTRRTV